MLLVTALSLVPFYFIDTSITLNFWNKLPSPLKFQRPFQERGVWKLHVNLLGEVVEGGIYSLKCSSSLVIFKLSITNMKQLNKFITCIVQFQKTSIATPRKVIGKFLGEGSLKSKNFRGKVCMEAKLEFPRGRGGAHTKKPSVGRVWIFSGTAH